MYELQIENIGESDVGESQYICVSPAQMPFDPNCDYDNCCELKKKEVQKIRHSYQE